MNNLNLKATFSSPMQQSHPNSHPGSQRHCFSNQKTFPKVLSRRRQHCSRFRQLSNRPPLHRPRLFGCSQLCSDSRFALSVRRHLRRHHRELPKPLRRHSCEELAMLCSEPCRCSLCALRCAHRGLANYSSLVFLSAELAREHARVGEELRSPLSRSPSLFCMLRSLKDAACQVCLTKVPTAFLAEHVSRTAWSGKDPERSRVAVGN
jgi:hypothetical protein